MLANWYHDFMVKKLTAGVCFSPLRLGFVTRAGVLFRAEEYPQAFHPSLTFHLSPFFSAAFLICFHLRIRFCHNFPEPKSSIDVSPLAPFPPFLFFCFSLLVFVTLRSKKSAQDLRLAVHCIYQLSKFFKKILDLTLRYADIVELKALARLVGPYGVKLVEREVHLSYPIPFLPFLFFLVPSFLSSSTRYLSFSQLLKFVLANVAPVREAVVANVTVLEEILGTPLPLLL